MWRNSAVTGLLSFATRLAFGAAVRVCLVFGDTYIHRAKTRQRSVHLIKLNFPLRPVRVQLVLGHVVQNHVHVIVKTSQRSHKLLVRSAQQGRLVKRSGL